MSANWIEFKNGQYPRRGEIIVVKGKGEPEIYPYILIVKGTTEFFHLRE
jgi:hypothetical protein